MISNIANSEPTTDFPISDDTVHTMASMTSPFISRSPPAGVPPQVMVVTGNPGLGKTMFLFVLLAFRPNAKLPTMSQSDPTNLYFFAAKHVYLIQGLDAAHSIFPVRCLPPSTRCLPPSTRCLVDANSTFATVPRFITGPKKTIVQSASPRLGRFEWLRRVVYPYTMLYVRLWTISELIRARELQPRVPPERALAAFAARAAFRDAGSTEEHERYVRRRISVWLLELEAMIGARDVRAFEARDSRVFEALDPPDEVVALVPGPSYCEFSCTIPTSHLFRAVLDAYLCRFRDWGAVLVNDEWGVVSGVW
ncbi:hypothetical protein BJ138DRAFT_207100 [Hygrophoropsis aurantiaca]|uniref:Uncharacterized protein n=1 Tax=Hygrophoropsis aurantiaca TaxID=72124 RepID=A0ACB8A8Q0_9AGAM|nr:hypothetical protein BJ138DRAFT_207100 [Hygrophoropsis aurantiaca]